MSEAAKGSTGHDRLSTIRATLAVLPNKGMESEDQVSDEKAWREETGLDPDLDTGERLATFEAEREVLAVQLSEAKTVLANLTANLPEETRLPTRGSLFADVIKRPDGPSREHSLFGRDDYYDEDAGVDEQVMAAAAALLPSPESLSPVYADSINDDISTSIDKATYINLWQLHRLRHSPRKVARLLQVQEAEGVRISPQNLRAKVLENWMHDGTAHYHEFSHIEDYAYHSRSISDPQNQAWQAIELVMQRR